MTPNNGVEKASFLKLKFAAETQNWMMGSRLISHKCLRPNRKTFGHFGPRGQAGQELDGQNGRLSLGLMQVGSRFGQLEEVRQHLEFDYQGSDDGQLTDHNIGSQWITCRSCASADFRLSPKMMMSMSDCCDFVVAGAV